MSAALDLREAAEYLRLGESTLRQHVARGEIASVRIGGFRRFLKEDLDS